MTPTVLAVGTSAAVHHTAALMFVSSARRAIEARGVFRVALSGGSTPRGMYARLVDDQQLRQQVRWDNVRFFWSDERSVPPDDVRNNYGLAWAALLQPLSIAPNQIRRIRGELSDPDRAAREYEQAIRDDFAAHDQVVPRFDLILLGMGADGHTASLFPHSPALRERQRLVVSNHAPQLDTRRITMTVPLLNAAEEVIVLVAGADKAPALRDVLHGPRDAERLPAQLVQPADGRVTWIVDDEAIGAGPE
jgi:6-phosphogluconolactonase